MDTLTYIIKKFNLHTWKAKLPIEIPDTDRVTLANLFNELGFTKGVEIGVEEGKYSDTLCKANKNLKLYCVDPWLAFDVYRKQLDQAYVDNLMNNALARLKGRNVEIVRKTSMDAVKDFEDDSLDFVYIDGNHRLEYVVNDLASWTRKVRIGGIISGHDWVRMAYSSEKKWNDPMQVTYAVRAFTDAYKINPWFLLGTSGVLPGQKREKMRSYFWVKGEDRY